MESPSQREDDERDGVAVRYDRERGQELLAKTGSEFKRIGQLSKRGSRRSSRGARSIRGGRTRSTSGEIPRDDDQDDEGHDQKDTPGKRAVRRVDNSPKRVACSVKDPADDVREATADRSQQPVHRKSVRGRQRHRDEHGPRQGGAGRPV